MPDLSLLHSLLPAVRIRAFEETVSTNRDARDWLLSGAQHGDLILAERQTQGRGRLGRSFSSPEGGLYMTLILRMPPSPGPVTTLCAVAVCRVLEKLTSFQPRIKWVNDVLVENKKVWHSLRRRVAGKRAVGYGSWHWPKCLWRRAA